MASREVLGRFGQHQQDHAASTQMPVLHAVCLLTGTMTAHGLWLHVDHIAAQHKSFVFLQPLLPDATPAVECESCLQRRVEGSGSVLLLLAPSSSQVFYMQQDDDIVNA